MHAAVIENRHTSQRTPPSVGSTPWDVRSRRTDDVDAHASHLSGWEQRYDQLTPGRFDGVVDEVVQGTAQAFRERNNRALRQRCCIPRGAIWIGITAAHDGSRINGREVGADGVMVSGSADAFDLVSPSCHDIYGIVVSRTDVLAHAAQQGRCVDLPASMAATWLDVGHGRKVAALGHLRVILDAAAGLSAAEPQRRSSAAWQPLRAALLDVALELIAESDDAPAERCNAWSRRALLANVDAWLQARPDKVPTVPDLCAHLHVSRRTLQNAFMAATATTPAGYLRCIRLNQARRALRVAERGSTKVQDIATASGFWHLSQFATDYRRLFGESPSQTIGRR